MKFVLDNLPYELDELEPHISARTVDFHYNKHHAGYMAKLEAALQGDSKAEWPLDEIIRDAHKSKDLPVYRNAAQVWNHTFYWNSITPNGGGKPDGLVATLLERDFGSVQDFKSRFAEVASGQFGSGWAWLVLDADGRLKVESTPDADNPLTRDLTPILTLDVWEHAYYLDYQNDRGGYIESLLDNLLNWHFAEANTQVAAAAHPVLQAKLAG